MDFARACRFCATVSSSWIIARAEPRGLAMSELTDPGSIRLTLIPFLVAFLAECRTPQNPRSRHGGT